MERILNGKDLDLVREKPDVPANPTGLLGMKLLITDSNGKITIRHFWKTTKEDIPEERCNIEFHVSGKCITIRKPRNLLSNVKPEFKKKFYVVVDALCISDQLETHKHNFKVGLFYSDVEPAIVKKLYQILKPLGYIEDEKEAKSLNNTFTKSLQTNTKRRISRTESKIYFWKYE